MNQSSRCESRKIGWNNKICNVRLIEIHFLLLLFRIPNRTEHCMARARVFARDDTGTSRSNVAPYYVTERKGTPITSGYSYVPLLRNITFQQLFFKDPFKPFSFLSFWAIKYIMIPPMDKFGATSSNFFSNKIIHNDEFEPFHKFTKKKNIFDIIILM